MTRDLFGDAPPPPRRRWGGTMIGLWLVIHAETEAAVLVSSSASDIGAVWLPRSEIDIDETGATLVRTARGARERAYVHVPEALAAEKGLIL